MSSPVKRNWTVVESEPVLADRTERGKSKLPGQKIGGFYVTEITTFSAETCLKTEWARETLLAAERSALERWPSHQPHNITSWIDVVYPAKLPNLGKHFSKTILIKVIIILTVFTVARLCSVVRLPQFVSAATRILKTPRRQRPITAGRSTLATPPAFVRFQAVDGAPQGRRQEKEATRPALWRHAVNSWNKYKDLSD